MYWLSLDQSKCVMKLECPWISKGYNFQYQKNNEQEEIPEQEPIRL
jgi:hypothetical protein